MGKQGFGPIVRSRRKSKHITIEQLAELCDMSDRGISNIEREVSMPRLDTVLQICSICGINVGELSELDFREGTE